MNRLCVISIEYGEPDWCHTEDSLNSLGLKINYVSRKGVGSLARAINAGFYYYTRPEHEYVLFITNVTFAPNLAKKLVEQMDKTGLAAITPAFASDHVFCRPIGKDITLTGPFVEFTCLIVRASVFADFYLDEKMPYWGHDLDWGYRLKQAGYKVGVYHGLEIGHVYIRHNKKPHFLTVKRAELRKQADVSTTRRLIEKYGRDWRDVVWPK